MDEKAVRTAVPDFSCFFNQAAQRARQFKDSGKQHIIRAMVQR